VVQILDDHHGSRYEQEESHGREDLPRDFPERHAGDEQAYEERDHLISSPARGSMVIALPRVLNPAGEQVRCQPPLTFCIRFRFSDERGRWANIGRALFVFIVNFWDM
jgi:hypothetical protein